MNNKAKAYISLVSASGIAAMACAFLYLHRPHDPLQFWTYLLLSVLAATLKLQLPGLRETMSIGFVLVLLGISELTFPETMLLACAGAAVQCLWRPKHRTAPVQVLFSVSAVAISLTLAYGCSHLVRTHLHAGSVSVLLAVATCVYFIANSLLVSGVLSLVRREPLRVIWQQCYLLAFPYYLLGGAVAGLMAASGRESGWMPALLILPVIGLAFLFYRFYLAWLAMAPAAAASGTTPLTVETRGA
jgi:hypothetical protein